MFDGAVKVIVPHSSPVAYIESGGKVGDGVNVGVGVTVGVGDGLDVLDSEGDGEGEAV